MSEENIILVHLGTNLPIYMKDCIHQLVLYNKNSKIYLILTSTIIPLMLAWLIKLNISVDKIECINADSINMSENYNQFKDKIRSIEEIDKISNFRNNFWIYTIERFFYIEALFKEKELKSAFHTENDVMVYNNLNSLNLIKVPKGIHMVKDSPQRIIGSLMYFCDEKSIESLCNYIVEQVNEKIFKNDMELLLGYPYLLELPIRPDEDNEFVYDGAAIGQYMDGIDPRNLNPSDVNEITEFLNPTKKFINETADIKISDYHIIKHFDENSLKYYNLNNQSKIVNIHVHSKQLYKFSSIFDLEINEIITGDRILDIVDYYITSREISNFHKEISFYEMKRYFIEDLSIFKQIFLQNNVIKIFVYTHLLDGFIEYFKNKQYIIESMVHLYCHNSDYSFTEEQYIDLKGIFPKILFFVQNPGLPAIYGDVRLVPIGIANYMWPHGDLIVLYRIISQTFNLKKKLIDNSKAGIYVNFNKVTYRYRQHIHNYLKNLEKTSTNIVFSEEMQFRDYLNNLRGYHFCICPRGNGMDTHRFWEALYLRVIPILIRDDTSEYDNFLKRLSLLGLPYIVLNSIEDFNPDDFTVELYNKLYTNKFSVLKIQDYLVN